MAILRMKKSFEFLYLKLTFRGEPLTVDVLLWLLLFPFTSEKEMQEHLLNSLPHFRPMKKYSWGAYIHSANM